MTSRRNRHLWRRTRVWRGPRPRRYSWRGTRSNTWRHARRHARSNCRCCTRRYTRCRRGASTRASAIYVIHPVRIREANVSHRHGIRRAATYCADVARPGLRIWIGTDKEDVASSRSIRCRHFHDQLERPSGHRHSYWHIEDAVGLVRYSQLA